MSDRPLMKCGCVAMAVCSQKGGRKFDPPIPACFVHECYEIAESPPDLTGRKARCDYYGQPTRKSETHYPEMCGEICMVEVPSSFDLPFFVYQGADSRYATQKCKNCGYDKSTHNSPYYRNSKKVNPNKCVNQGKQFEPIGDSGYDNFYCGCHSWD